MDDSSAIARALRLATAALQLLLVGVVGYAITRGKVGLVLNTALPLAIASIPLAVRHRYDYRLNPVLSLLIVTGAAFHGVGALGLYRSIGWFDQVAHGVAGALIAGTGYALVQVVDTQHDDVVVPPKLRFAFVIVFALSIGVAWELAEFASELAAERFGGEPIIAQYDLADVVLDLAFDGIGALVVGLWGTSYFDGVRRLANRQLGTTDRWTDRGGSASGERD